MELHKDGTHGEARTWSLALCSSTSTSCATLPHMCHFVSAASFFGHCYLDHSGLQTITDILQFTTSFPSATSLPYHFVMKALCPRTSAQFPSPLKLRLPTISVFLSHCSVCLHMHSNIDTEKRIRKRIQLM